MAWNTNQYLNIAELRFRPAQDLIERISIGTPEHIYDLGCGPGNVTRLLLDRCLTDNTSFAYELIGGP